MTDLKPCPFCGGKTQGWYVIDRSLQKAFMKTYILDLIDETIRVSGILGELDDYVVDNNRMPPVFDNRVQLCMLDKIEVLKKRVENWEVSK